MLSKLTKTFKNRIPVKNFKNNLLSVKYFGAKVKDISGPSDREVDKSRKPANPKTSSTASDTEKKQTNKTNEKINQTSNKTTESSTQTVNRSVSSNDLGKNAKETTPNNTTVNKPSNKGDAKNQEIKSKKEAPVYQPSNVKQVESVPGHHVNI